MKITTIGCGNAFSKINFNQCFMLEDVDIKVKYFKSPSRINRKNNCKWFKPNKVNNYGK